MLHSGRLRFCNKLECCPQQAFSASLVFVGKVRSLPCSGASERCFTQAGSSSVISLSVVPGKSFLPSLVFVGKVRSLP